MRLALGQSAVWAVAIGLAFAVQAHAGDGCCAHCGCAAPCQKVCRLVCEEKKIEITCWGCKTEEFCLPGPSKRGCRHSETVCDLCEASCDSTLPHAKPKTFVWTEWFPSCARIFTKKKLMKKTETVTVPSYKWVVEDLCNVCEANCPCASVPPGADIPPPPVAGAKVKIAPTSQVSLEPAR